MRRRWRRVFGNGLPNPETSKYAALNVQTRIKEWA